MRTNPLTAIDFYDPGERVQMKQMTLKHCYKVIKTKKQKKLEITFFQFQYVLVLNLIIFKNSL